MGARAALRPSGEEQAGTAGERRRKGGAVAVAVERKPAGAGRGNRELGGRRLLGIPTPERKRFGLLPPSSLPRAPTLLPPSSAAAAPRPPPRSGLPPSSRRPARYLHPPPVRTQVDPPPRHGNGPRRKQAMDRVGSGEKHLEDCTVANALGTWVFSVAGALLAIPVGIKRKSFAPLVFFGTTGTMLDIIMGISQCEREHAERQMKLLEAQNLATNASVEGESLTDSFANVDK